MPADMALFRVVHTAVSTAPVDLKPRGMMNERPEDLKHEAVDADTDAETSTPLPLPEGVGGVGVGGVGVGALVTQHWRSEGPTQ